MQRIQFKPIYRFGGVHRKNLKVFIKVHREKKRWCGNATTQCMGLNNFTIFNNPKKLDSDAPGFSGQKFICLSKTDKCMYTAQSKGERVI